MSIVSMLEKDLDELFDAACDGDVEVLERLLGKGVNVEADLYGETALLLAVESGHTKAVEFLLDNGANIEFQTGSDELTALMKAVSGNKIDCVKLLLNRGANIEQRNICDSLAIDIAHARDHFEIEIILAIEHFQQDINIGKSETEKQKNYIKELNSKLFSNNHSDLMYEGYFKIIASVLLPIVENNLGNLIREKDETIRNIIDDLLEKSNISYDEEKKEFVVNSKMGHPLRKILHKIKIARNNNDRDKTEIVSLDPQLSPEDKESLIIAHSVFDKITFIKSLDRLEDLDNEEQKEPSRSQLLSSVESLNKNYQRSK